MFFTYLLFVSSSTYSSYVGQKIFFSRSGAWTHYYDAPLPPAVSKEELNRRKRGFKSVKSFKSKSKHKRR